MIHLNQFIFVTLQIVIFSLSLIPTDVLQTTVDVYQYISISSLARRADYENINNALRNKSKQLQLTHLANDSYIFYFYYAYTLSSFVDNVCTDSYKWEMWELCIIVYIPFGCTSTEVFSGCLYSMIFWNLSLSHVNQRSK